MPFATSRSTVLPLALALSVLLGLLVIYAAQTGLGHWQVDEFRYFADHNDLGWRAYFERFDVSPRPISELLIYAYGSLALAFDRSFVSAALLTIWGASLFGIATAAYTTSRRAPGQFLAAVSLSIAPMIFVMQISPVTELFYWPIASVAYLPMVAALTCLMFLLADEPKIATRRGWCCLALLIATLSHEIGAAAAIGFALAVAALDIILPRPKRLNTWWWLFPAMAGICVMLGLVLFRSRFVDLGSDTKPYTGRLIASALVALRQMPIDIVTTATFPHDAAGIVAALIQKIAFATGFALIWIRHASIRPSRWLISFGIGLAAAIYFSLLGAYYHYGQLCCERQATTRQWLIELVLIIVAASALLLWQARRKNAGKGAGWYVGPLLLTVSLLPVIAQIPAIRIDFEQLPMAGAARFRTWQSGLTPGPRMQLYMPPDNKDMLIHGTSTAVGTFNLVGIPFDPSDIVAAVGRFFGKTTVDVCQAWQTQDSFLIDGNFIPACPPHDGPPDRVFNTR